MGLTLIFYFFGAAGNPERAVSTYLVGDGEPALLRLQQDTVFLLIAVPAEEARPAGASSKAGGRPGAAIL